MGGTDAARPGGSTREGYPLARGDFIWLLGSICALHRKPFDERLLLQQFPPPYTVCTFLQAAQGLGFEAELCDVPSPEALREKIPCVLFEPRGADDGGGVTPALAVRSDGKRALILPAGAEQPQTEEIADYLTPGRRFAARVQAPAAAAAMDEPDAGPPRFGFRWFIPELLRYKAVWRDVVLASLAVQVMGLATPLFTQVIIDKVIVHHTMNTLVVVAFALLMFMLFGAAMTWVRQLLVLHTGNRIDAILGARVFRHLFELPLRYFERRPTGTLVARMHGVETIREFIAGAAVTLLLDVPFVLVFLAVMFYYSWQLTLVVLCVLLLIAGLSLAVTPVLRLRLNEQFQLGARNQAFLTEYLNGVETVKSLQMEPQLNRRFGDYLASYLGASFGTRRLSNTYNVAANTLEQLQVLTILALGAWLVMTSDGFTIGMLVAFQMFASRLAQPVLRMVGLWLEFQQASIAVKRLGDIMDAPAEPYAVLPVRTANGHGRIEVLGLSFRYGNDHPYLYRDLEMTIEPGTTVSILGASGSGKSTLAKILQGFYLPTEGRVAIDGRDTRYLSANELRGNFGVVPQETVLFSGTIYENLIVANPHAGFPQVVQACRMAEIHETIERLPGGYQTEIGEHGAGLSGGQKQRLAIARALLKRPKVLVFDEATSHLDPPTAEHIAQTINRLKGKVSILFITHQPPKTLRIDDTVVLGGHSLKATRSAESVRAAD